MFINIQVFTWIASSASSRSMRVTLSRLSPFVGKKNIKCSLEIINSLGIRNAYVSSFITRVNIFYIISVPMNPLFPFHIKNTNTIMLNFIFRISDFQRDVQDVYCNYSSLLFGPHGPHGESLFSLFHKSSKC